MKVCLDCRHRFEAKDWQCPNCGQLPQMHSRYPFFAPQVVADYGGFEARFFRRLAKIEKGNFWFESRNHLLIKAFQRYFPKARNFMEIGCGTGFVLSRIQKEFPDLALYGSDMFVEGLEYAEKRTPGASFFQMDAGNIPFDKEFDAIGAFDVLEHIDDDQAVLRQMFRATKTGGGILITVPQHMLLWSNIDVISHHRRRYSRAEILDKMNRVGFKIVWTTSFITFLFPIMLLFRLINKNSRIKEGHSLNEFRIPDFLNHFLDKVCAVETSFLTHGKKKSFHFGGSLLVIGMKD